jgi:dsDNA-binding SOS-regulon protein
LFCNPAQPVNQSAERILFAPDPQDNTRIQMHVQIQYAGPPTGFSWMLPVPANTDFAISTEALFLRLDQRYTPIFRLNREFEENCPALDFGYQSESVPTAESGNRSGEPQVQVLSREIVGPYDKVVLTADTVGVLTEWLTENGYQVPDRAEEVLSPYLADFAFIAIRLTPSEGVDSIKPISLTLSSPAPSIPIIPTSVAAQPDMGILVHLLGSSRAISTNYAHVQINEAVIDWQNNAQNYTDVVSQAIDEAGGQAFVTDFAGDHELGDIPFTPINSNEVAQIEQAQNLKQAIEANVHTYISHIDYGEPILDHGVLTLEQWTEAVDCWNFVNGIQFDPNYGSYQGSAPPEEETEECQGVLNNEELVFDGEAVAAAIREVNVIYNNLNTIFSTHPYLTRLYSTLSADEMTVDPSFGYNTDLDDVERTRQATLLQDCNGNGLELTLSNGHVVNVRNESGPEMIERQEGETVRGMGEIAAQIIERQMPAGQPDLIEDRTAMIQAVSDDESGCQSTHQSISSLMILLFGFMLVWKRRQVHL